MKAQQYVTYILRLGVVGIFAGHGWLAFHLNSHWFTYLHTAGIQSPNYAVVMKIIGVMDICIALITLVKPLPSVLLWAAFWAFLTALMRPISGEAWVGFVERAGNWACPLALWFWMKKR